MAAEIRMALPLDAQSLIDALPEATIVLNALEQVEFVNGAAERLFGYRASELHGNKINFLFSSELEENFTMTEAVARVKSGDLRHVQLSRGDVPQTDTRSGYILISVRTLDHLDTLHPCMM